MRNDMLLRAGLLLLFIATNTTTYVEAHLRDHVLYSIDEGEAVYSSTTGQSAISLAVAISSRTLDNDTHVTITRSTGAARDTAAAKYRLNQSERDNNITDDHRKGDQEQMIDHDQIHRRRNLRKGRAPPDLLKQVYNPKLHKCQEAGEAYSAAYLIHKEHLLYQFTGYNLTWVNCEMASFIMMGRKPDPNSNKNGTVLQTMDALDFSVIHLSAFERLQRRWARTAGNSADMTPIAVAADMLRERVTYLRAVGAFLPVPTSSSNSSSGENIGDMNGENRKKLMPRIFRGLSESRNWEGRRNSDENTKTADISPDLGFMGHSLGFASAQSLMKENEKEVELEKERDWVGEEEASALSKKSERRRRVSGRKHEGGKESVGGNAKSSPAGKIGKSKPSPKSRVPKRGKKGVEMGDTEARNSNNNVKGKGNKGIQQSVAAAESGVLEIDHLPSKHRSVFRDAHLYRKNHEQPLLPGSFSQNSNETLVIMPFLGSDMGAGHSKLTNRLNYLHACFWSFYEKFEHIVASVKSKKDWEFARKHSGLPFFDVIILPDLPKSAGLPVGTVQETKRRMQPGGEWEKFNYLFYTESDQILMMRSEVEEQLYEYIDKYPRQLLVPHRLMPYPENVLTKHHGREINRNNPLDWQGMQCCMPRTNCPWDRKEWVHLRNATAVPVLNIYGLQVPLGNSNFHDEKYRHCTLYEQGGLAYCP